MKSSLKIGFATGLVAFALSGGFSSTLSSNLTATTNPVETSPFCPAREIKHFQPEVEAKKPDYLISSLTCGNGYNHVELNIIN
jgi:hypothetical protein